MDYHPAVNKIKELLTTNNAWFETFEHEAVKTSEEAAKIRTGYTINQGAKAMLVKLYLVGNTEKFVMIVAPGNSKFDSKKAVTELGARKIRFATEEEVATLTNDVLPGGIPPFGNIFNLETYVDASLFENEKIVFNAGDKRFSIGMNSKDYKEIVKPTIVHIV